MKPILVDTYPAKSTEPQDNSPIVLILQGVEIDKAEYAPLARQLATLGFRVVVPNFIAPSGDFICPTPSSVADFLGFAETSLPEIQDLQTSQLILFGHSAGGIAAFGAFATESPTLTTHPTAIVTYGSNTPRLDAIQYELPPTLMMAGLKDKIVPPQSARAGLLNLPSTRKSFLSLLNFHHYSITKSGSPEPRGIKEPCGERAASILAQISGTFVASAIAGQSEWEGALAAGIMTEIESLESV